MTDSIKFYGFNFRPSGGGAGGASPELSSAQNCFKMTLVVTNIIFLIFGCVLCGVGAYAMSSKAGSLAGETLPQGIIVLGVFILLVSLLGCFAAFKESRLFLGVYSAFLSLFVIVLLAVGIGVYAKKDSAQQYMVDGWCEAPPEVQADIQQYFMCCGLYSFNDSKGYSKNEYPSHPFDADVLPACPKALRKKIYKNYPYEYLPCPSGLAITNSQACLGVLQSSFNSSYQIAGACSIAFAVLMGVGMAVVCVLMRAIKEKKHLEAMRKLHRKLRDTRDGGGANEGEDPNAAPSSSVLAQRDAESGYGPAEGEADLSAVEIGGSAFATGGDAQLGSGSGAATAPRDEYDEDEEVTAGEQQHYVVGGGAGARGGNRVTSPPAAAAASSARSGKARRAVDEYDEEEEEDEEYAAPPPRRGQRQQQKQQAKAKSSRRAAAAPLDMEYDEEEASVSAAPAPGYTKRDDEYEEEDY